MTSYKVREKLPTEGMDFGEVWVNVVEQLVAVTETHLSEVSHSSVEMSDQVERSLGGHVQEEGRRSSR